MEEHPTEPNREENMDGALGIVVTGAIIAAAALLLWWLGVFPEG